MSQPKPPAANTVSCPPLPCVVLKQLDWRQPWPRSVHIALANICIARKIAAPAQTLAQPTLFYHWCLNNRTRYLILFYELIKLGYRLPDLPAGPQQLNLDSELPAFVSDVITKIRKESTP